MASSPTAKPPLYRFRPWSSVFGMDTQGGATKPMTVPVSSASRKAFPGKSVGNRRELDQRPQRGGHEAEGQVFGQWLLSDAGVENGARQHEPHVDDIFPKKEKPAIRLAVENAVAMHGKLAQPHEQQGDERHAACVEKKAAPTPAISI